MRLLSLFLSFLSLCASVRAQYASTHPAPISLFHKSPYLNGFIPADANVSSTPASRWPRFFSGPDLGWFLGLRVDGTPYVIQGVHVNYTSARTIGAYITPTRTTFVVEAGPVRANISYLTPIELSDWTRHSLPFVYLAVDVWWTDGASHSLQLYTDVAGQFVSSNGANKITWNSIQTNRLVYHVMNQTNYQSLTENADMSEDGSQCFAYKSTPGVTLTWQIASEKIRIDFITAGNLTNTTESNFRAINDDWAVSAFALDFGNVSRTAAPLVFAVGLVRDPVVNYQTPSKLEPRSQLWRKKWSDVGSAIDDFLSGYPSALSRAVDFDNSIASATSAISSKFGMASSAAVKLADLVILSLRQTVGSLEFTASRLSSQEMDDLRVFMKDVGNSRRVNPVEIIYASFPAFLYLNATLAGRLLEPLLEFQSSSLYRQVYAAPDLGSSWPNVLGNNTDDPLFAIDSCGAMLVMALAQARKSGNGKLLFTYYDVLRKWADYLVTKSVQPNGFATADGVLTATSNLVLKGIMGIYAMGQINKILEAKGADSSLTLHYLDTARNYAQQWRNSVVTSDHVLSAYGNNASWGLLYNLYAPRLLGADIIPEDIYELQAGWYLSRSTAVPVPSIQPYGLPYESSQSVTVKAHWTLLAAGSVFNSTSKVQDILLSMVHARSFLQTGQRANPSTYSAVDGTLMTGTASPAMGAAFALLALGLPDLTISDLPSGSVNGSGATSQVPAIVGGVIGGIAGIGVVILLAFLYVRRSRSGKGEDEDDDEEDEDIDDHRAASPGTIATGPSLITPFMSEFDNREGRPSSSQAAAEDAVAITYSPIRNPVNPSHRLGDGRIDKSGTMDPESAKAAVATGTGTGTGGSVISESGSRKMSPPQDDDHDLRREVEQLRMVVETLREQQTPQSRVVYQDLNVPDEPPPYGPPPG